MEQTTQTQSKFYNLRAAVTADVEQRHETELKRISTPEDLAAVMKWHGKSYKKDAEKFFIKWLTSRKDAKLKDYLRTIGEVENADDFEELVITVEWKKSRMWGNNPKAYTNHGFEGELIGGCGYDKHSTATAQALNSYKPLLKLLYAKMDKALGEGYIPQSDNRELFGYGTGYYIIPDFHGGVGVGCHRNICEKLGLFWRNVSNASSTDVHVITVRE